MTASTGPGSSTSRKTDSKLDKVGHGPNWPPNARSARPCVPLDPSSSHPSCGLLAGVTLMLFDVMLLLKPADVLLWMYCGVVRGIHVTTMSLSWPRRSCYSLPNVTWVMLNDRQNAT